MGTIITLSLTSLQLKGWSYAVDEIAVVSLEPTVHD